MPTTPYFNPLPVPPPKLPKHRIDAPDTLPTTPNEPDWQAPVGAIDDDTDDNDGTDDAPPDGGDGDDDSDADNHDADIAPTIVDDPVPDTDH